MKPLVQATHVSNTALQKGKRKLDQCSESEAPDCPDPWQPKVRTKSTDTMICESAANSWYPEQSFSSHVGNGLRSAQISRERSPANQDSESSEHSSSDFDQVPLPPSLHGQSGQTEAQHMPGSSDLSSNARDREYLTPNTVITKTERVESEDMMQSIRSQVLRAWEAQQSTKLGLTLSIRCNLREFMEKQFAGSNRSLGRVITINGTATCGHATTCSDYISSNWPLRGLWLLNILQDTFDRAKSNVEGNWPL